MSDIVERLRALAREYHQHRPHYDEAADEIERLHQLSTAARRAVDYHRLGYESGTAFNANVMIELMDRLGTTLDETP